MLVLAIPRSRLAHLLACLLVYLLAASLLTACTAPLITPPPALTPTPTAESAQKTHELFTDPATTNTPAYAALLSEFTAKRPEFDLHDAASAATSANDLADHLLRLHNTPLLDSWQVPIGQQTLDDYAKIGLIEPLDFLFTQYNLAATLPPALIPTLTFKGNIFIVPLAIQRTNLLWYNPQLLAGQNITVPTTIDELITAAGALKSAGLAAPLAVGNQETVLHLFETTLLAALGPQTYNNLWTGADDWSRPEITTALEQFGKLLSFTAPTPDLDWQQTAQLVLDGKAAFYIMDDRLANWAPAEGQGQGFAYALAPGTSGVFQFGGRGFVLSASSPNRGAAIAWLAYIGSQPAQDIFNLGNNSIPPRLDADRTRYDGFHQTMMPGWAANTLAGSLSLGAVAGGAWKSEIEIALIGFLASKDITAFQSALAAACKTSGPCP